MFDTILIFHYHLLPGGVTQVIAKSIDSVLLHIPEVQHIRVITGRRENTGKEKDLSREGRSLEWETIPEFDYLPRQSAGDEAYRLVRNRLDMLSGECLWWVHNYHIGKNPLFTRALLDIAGNNGSQRMLFHIHDFPECSRFDNLDYLNEYCPLPLYPDLPNIRYCVINGRDRDILISAGLPEQKVFLLHDPVPRLRHSGMDKQKARKIVESFGKEKGKAYRPGGRHLFYPVRTIRRKNVLEAGLVNQLLEDETNLVVTLPGVSKQEYPYSALVQACFKDGLIEGLFGTGAIKEAPPFEVMIAASDMVISSSVQEGFGYLFLNALQWGLPLVARDLDILSGIGSVFDGYPCSFYTGIRVPFSKSSVLELQKQYRQRLNALSKVLGNNLREHLESEIKKLGDETGVDYSYLSPLDQTELLRKITTVPAYKKETQDLNKSVIESIEALLTGEWSGNPGETAPLTVESEFGLKAFAAGFEQISASFLAKPIPASGMGGDQEAIIRRFSVLENIRLLYE